MHLPIQDDSVPRGPKWTPHTQYHTLGMFAMIAIEHLNSVI